MSTLRRWSGVIAALVVALMGILSLPQMRYASMALILMGLVTAGIQIWYLWKERPDPYDLNRLWDAPLPEDIQPEDHPIDDDMAYCHRCGHAVPPPYGRCPECGTVVR